MSITLEQAKSRIDKAFKAQGIDGVFSQVLGIKMGLMSMPLRPSLDLKHTLEEAKGYVSDLEKYEINVTSYIEQFAEIRNLKIDIDNYVSEIISKKSGLNKIPLQYKSRVLSVAIKLSDGDEMMYKILKELVEIFD